MKLTNTQIESIKSMREQGLTYKEIADRFKVNPTTIYYHLLNKEDKNKRKKEIVKTFNKKTKKQKQEAYKKRLPTMIKYQNKRYAEDEEYREMKKEYARKYYRRKNETNNKVS